jgi:iron complex outermembrane receptor protein
MRAQEERSVLMGVRLFVLIFAILAGSSSAIAQEPEENNGNRAGALEEILVTARRRTENLQDVPISIEVFSQADIDAKSLTSLQELSQFVPNFSMYNAGIDGSLSNNVFMRGIGNSLGGPGVGIYLDGVYLSTQQAIDLGMLDIERVELLFGPQGTLFGRNTIGGAVSYVSAKPTGEFSGSAEVDVGTFSRFDASVSLNGPLLPGTLNGRIAIGVQNRDGYGKVLDYYSGKQIDEMGNRDRWSGRLLLDWIISDDVNVLFSIEGAELNDKVTVKSPTQLVPTAIHNRYNNILLIDPPWGANLLPPDIYSSYATYRGGMDNFNTLRSWGGSVTVNWNINDTLAFKSISALREYETGFGQDLDFSPHPINIGLNYNDQDQFSQEFQLNGVSFDGRLDWVAGLYYFTEDFSNPSASLSYEDLINAGVQTDTRRWINNITTNDSWAVFGEGTYDITDKLSTTLGLRYTEDEKTEFSERVSVIDGGYGCAACQRPYYGEMNINDTSGRANLAYNWTEDFMTYVSASRGFKSGGLSAGSVSIVQDRTLVSYEPEYVWTYELGMKSTLLDDRLRLNATAFYSDYQDIQYQFFYSYFEGGVPVTVNVVSNAAAAEIKGFELQALFEPIDSLTLSASVGRTDAQYTESDQRGGPLTLDSEFVQVPEWSYTVSGEYRIATGWGELRMRADYAWEDKVYFDVINTTNPFLQQPAYGLLNARITLDITDTWSVAAYGTNLTDEEHLLNALPLAGLGAPSIAQPGAPREWGVWAEYRF